MKIRRESCPFGRECFASSNILQTVVDTTPVDKTTGDTTLVDTSTPRLHVPLRDTTLVDTSTRIFSPYPSK